MREPAGRWDAEIRRRLAAARLEPATEALIVREIAQHLDDRYAELRALGHSRDDAERQALAELHEEEFMRRELSQVSPRAGALVVLGETRRRSSLGDLSQDIRYACRVLIASRGFTAVALVTLALGIGATTAIFSVVNGMLLTPLPYDPDERLVRIFQVETRGGGPGEPARISRYTPSYPVLKGWRARSDVLDGIAFISSEQLTLLDASPVERLRAGAVTPGFFELFDSAPVLGRTLTESDMTEPVALISHGCWQRRFGGDRNVIGRTIRALEGDRTIIGVLPPSFTYGSSELWVPLANRYMEKTAGWGGNLVARLRANVTPADAEHNLQALASQFADEGLWRAAAKVEVMPLHDYAVLTARPTLQMLLAAVGFILLLACVNVAGLLVARGAPRVREIAIRASLGASRLRLMRQLLTESLVLSLAGGAAGALLAWWTLAALVPMLPVSIPANMQPAIDARVLTFAFVLSAATGCLFGLVPAIQLTRAGARTLKEGGHGAAGANRGTARALVLVEVALAIVLLVGAGLMIRSLQRVLAIELGFDAERVLVVEAFPVMTGEGQPTRSAIFYRELIERISALPSVTAAGAIDTLPFWSARYGGVEAEGQLSKSARVSPRATLPEYFPAMGIPLRAGRDFTWQDAGESPCVAIVNEHAGRALWNDAQPLGRRIRQDAKGAWCEVIGVVPDVRHFSLESPALAEVYFAALQSTVRDLSVVARAAAPAALVPAARDRLTNLPEPAVIRRVGPIGTLVEASFAQRTQRAQLLSLFGALGLLLACVGIFGLTGYSVARRTPEIGIRIALGADAGRVLRTIMGGFVPAILGGVVFGLFGAWAASRAVEQYLYEVQPLDPLTLAGASTLFIAAALLACYLPARRALTVDPVIALRAE